MKRKSMKTMPIATGSDFLPSGVGVAMPMTGTINMHTAIPMAPTMKSQRRPKRSAVQTALRVKRMPMVAHRALMRLLDEHVSRLPSVGTKLLRLHLHGLGRVPNLLVDGSRVAVKGALAGELLADVEDEGKVETLADGLVLE